MRRDEVPHRCTDFRELRSFGAHREVNLGLAREIENVKTYGIAKIAREVLDIADHMGKAIQAL